MLRLKSSLVSRFCTLKFLATLHCGFKYFHCWDSKALSYSQSRTGGTVLRYLCGTEFGLSATSTRMIGLHIYFSNNKCSRLKLLIRGAKLAVTILRYCICPVWKWSMNPNRQNFNAIFDQVFKEGFNLLLLETLRE